MPDRPAGSEDADCDRESVDASVSGSSTELEGPSHGDGESGAEPTEPPHGDGDAETAESRRARVEAAKRRYRATLRNEADSGGGGFSEDYYRSQKPPHWS
ncbi:hypothetical protein GCM10010974_11230 [Brevibacterium sediminis]|uniref:Uncharacterized protein n=1 Tax=Brevibacterium sediminis TaxID=1857024 RepID=A0ABQ1LYZ6_9MICO|nr:hypothetical protein GCM10010974_11230 [Brevibacterium sediminis]